MPWEYECRQCEGRSPRRHDRRSDAESEQDQHRAVAHGGLVPAAGDRIRSVHTESRGDGCMPSGSLLFFLVLLAALLSNCWR